MNSEWLAVLAIAGQDFLQVMLLLLLAPLCSWMLAYGLAWLYGLDTPPIILDYKAFFGRGMRGVRHSLAPPQALGLSVSVLILAIIPGLPAGFLSSLFGAGGGEEAGRAAMADILLIGGLLLLGGGCAQRLPPFPALSGLVLMLCITEGLFVLAAPGMSSLEASAQAVHLLPDSGLAGTSACCALALALLAPLPCRKPEKSLLRPLTMSFPDDPAAWRAFLMQERLQKEQNTLLTMPLQMGWLLLLGNLLLPGFMGGEGGLAVLGLVFRLVVALAVMVFIQFAGIARQAGLIALLGGLALLLSLAGRFAL